MFTSSVKAIEKLLEQDSLAAEAPGIAEPARPTVVLTPTATTTGQPARDKVGVQMERHRFFLLWGSPYSTPDGRDCQTEVLAALEDLSQEDAKQIDAAIDMQLEKEGYEPFYLEKDEGGGPKSLLYLTRAQKTAKAMEAAKDPDKCKAYRIARLAISLAQTVRQRVGTINGQQAGAALPGEDAAADAADYHRWFLFYRRSQTGRCIDEADSGCASSDEWDLFTYVVDLTKSEMEVLLRALVDEFCGALDDEGQTRSRLWEFDALEETAAAKDTARYIRARRRWEALKNSYDRHPFAEGDVQLWEINMHLCCHELAEQIRSLRTTARLSLDDAGVTPKTFQVIDTDTSKSVVFDTADTKAYGPVDEKEGWNPVEMVPEFSVEATLYRHNTGHWTLVSEKEHWEVGQWGDPEARRLTDAEAADWLVRHSFEPPSDVAHLAAESLFRPDHPVPKAASEESSEDPSKPRWDSERRELLFRDVVCKKFRQPARNQCLLLDAFEELGWPPRIDDPIPPSGNVERRQRLADAVRGLRTNNQVIRFELDGTGEGVIWRPADEETMPSGNSKDVPF